MTQKKNAMTPAERRAKQARIRERKNARGKASAIPKNRNRKITATAPDGQITTRRSDKVKDSANVREVYRQAVEAVLEQKTYVLQMLERTFGITQADIAWEEKHQFTMNSERPPAPYKDRPARILSYKYGVWRNYLWEPKWKTYDEAIQHHKGYTMSTGRGKCPSKFGLLRPYMDYDAFMADALGFEIFHVPYHYFDAPPNALLKFHFRSELPSAHPVFKVGSKAPEIQREEEWAVINTGQILFSADEQATLARLWNFGKPLPEPLHDDPTGEAPLVPQEVTAEQTFEEWSRQARKESLIYRSGLGQLSRDERKALREQTGCNWD